MKSGNKKVGKKSLKIGEALHKELKLWCVEKEEEMFDFVEAAIKDRLLKLKARESK